MIKVSVICTTYNHEKYIRDALDGFVSQKTNFDYEVIVHDDASTDSTAEIVMEYAHRYPDLIKPILQKENQYSQRRNFFKESIQPQLKGEYIAMCEGDDFWIDENKLQLQVDFLDRNPQYSACVHNSYKLDVAKNTMCVMFNNEDHDIGIAEIIKNGQASYYQTASLMCRTKYLQNPPEFMHAGLDYFFGIYLSSEGPIHFMGRTMSTYRWGSEGSFTEKNRKSTKRQALYSRFVARVLQEVNEYTNYTYRELIEARILESNYRALYFEERFKEMRAPEYWELYRQESFANRFKMRLKQYFAPLYHVYRKLKY